MLRAAWVAQELLTTFELELTEVSLIPSQTGGIFQIRTPEKVIFDRKEYGGFPEPKILKQLVRDSISPQKKLGHSDTKSE